MYFLGEKVTNTTAGLIGEHIACQAVLQRGWACAMVQQDGFDLVAISPDGSQTYRVQVKACALSHRGLRRNTLQFLTGLGKHKRLPTREDYDIIALVSSEQRAVFFMPISDIKLAKISKSKNFFNPDCELSSWEQTIEVLKNEKRITEQTTLRNHRSRNGSSRNRIVSPPKRRGS
jgi:hypothetical protein